MHFLLGKSHLRQKLHELVHQPDKLSSDDKLRDSCYKKMSKIKKDALNKQKDDSANDEIEQFARITAMQFLNDSLQLIGEPSIKKKRLGGGKYPEGYNLSIALKSLGV
jgi:hypothetical protein